MQANLCNLIQFDDKRSSKVEQHLVFTPVFFNLFAAAEPYISAIVTHGTPWIDTWSSPATYSRLKLYRVSTDSFP